MAGGNFLVEQLIVRDYTKEKMPSSPLLPPQSNKSVPTQVFMRWI